MKCCVYCHKPLTSKHAGRNPTRFCSKLCKNCWQHKKESYSHLKAKQDKQFEELYGGKRNDED